MRIAHLADVHLDRPFAGLIGQAGDRSRERLRDGFRRCLQIAKERGVDLVTIGGDLWEEENVRIDTRRFVAHELAAAEVPVLLICGNHDPYLAGGNYERTEWPENVRVISSQELNEAVYGDTSIWAASWTGATLRADFLSEFHVPDDGRRHVLLIHGTSQRIEHFAGQSAHCPFDPELIEAAGFDGCLAGHIHGAREADRVVYPGPPEPLGWSETGRHTVAIVDLADGWNVELVDTNTHHYQLVEVDCDGCGSSAEISERVEESVKDLASDRLHLNAVLVGEVDVSCEVPGPSLVERWGPRFSELRITDSTRAGYDLDYLGSQETVAGLFVKRMRNLISESGEEDPNQKAQLEEAMLVGLRALDGRQDVIDVD